MHVGALVAVVVILSCMAHVATAKKRKDKATAQCIELEKAANETAAHSKDHQAVLGAWRAYLPCCDNKPAQRARVLEKIGSVALSARMYDEAAGVFRTALSDRVALMRHAPSPVSAAELIVAYGSTANALQLTFAYDEGGSMSLPYPSSFQVSVNSFHLFCFCCSFC